MGSVPWHMNPEQFGRFTGDSRIPWSRSEMAYGHTDKATPDSTHVWYNDTEESARQGLIQRADYDLGGVNERYSAQLNTPEKIKGLHDFAPAIRYRDWTTGGRSKGSN